MVAQQRHLGQLLAGIMAGGCASMPVDRTLLFNDVESA